MDSGAGIFARLGPKAGSNAGQQRAGSGSEGLFGPLPCYLLAQVDEAGAVMATQEALMGLGWSLPRSDFSPDLRSPSLARWRVG